MKKFRVNKVNAIPTVEINENNFVYDCWLSSESYLKIGKSPIHKYIASGEGEIVRHLCGNNRCINPNHLIKGNEFENADDEIEIRNFTVNLFKAITNDNSLDNEPMDRAFFIMVPRFAIWYNSNRRIEGSKYLSLTEVIKFGREEYRHAYVDRLTNTNILDKQLNHTAITKANQVYKLLKEFPDDIRLYITRNRYR